MGRESRARAAGLKPAPLTIEQRIRDAEFGVMCALATHGSASFNRRAFVSAHAYLAQRVKELDGLIRPDYRGTPRTRSRVIELVWL